MPVEIEKIFLSATATDCRAYRLALKDAVESNIAGAKIALQEDWATGASFVSDECRRRVQEQHGYIGLFGHRYGWLPPGHTVSITELEFLWATAHWPEREPPIFIFLPREGSKADKALRARADKVLDQEFATDPAARERSRAEQKAFIGRVRQWAAGRIINFYATEQQLREKGLSCVQNRNLELLRQARDGRRSGAPRVSGDELGRIGRGPQLRQLKAALRALAKPGAPPALALAVHGPENHGQLQFAELLAGWREWDDWAGAVELDLHAGQADRPHDPAALARWACDELRQPAAGPDPVAALAQVLAARLAARHLVVVLRAFGAEPGRWPAFVDGLWKPLLQALAPLLPPAAPGRLLWLIVDHDCAPVGDAACFGAPLPGQPGFDAGRVLALPELEPLADSDIEEWLESLNERQLAALTLAQRQAIAASAAAPVGRPADVYDRLQREPALQLRAI